MMKSGSRLPQLILLLLSLLTVVTGVLVFIHPAAIFPDPSWGYQVLRSMQHGGGFNMLVGPDHENIAESYGEFLSWWSPGQYLLPYLFKSLFLLSYGQTSAVTSTVCELAGLFGFYQLFNKLGFNSKISALSILFIACQQFYFTPFVFYNGGEVLLFAYLGWFLYGIFSLNRPSWKLVLFVLGTGLIGFFCKSSFMWMYAAGLLCLWIRVSRGAVTPAQWIIKGIWIGIPAVISIALIYFGYLSKGNIPASASSHIRLTLNTIAFPLASPALAGFSGDDLTRGLIYHPDGPVFTPAGTVIVLLLMAIVSVALVWWILKYIDNREYRLAIAAFYGVAILFFGYAYLRQMAISYEGRHFRIVGLLVIPGTIYLVSRAKAGAKLAFGMIWAFIAVTSIVFMVHGYYINNTEGAHGNSGLSQQFIDQETLDYVITQDNSNSDAVFAFISPDLGLEINKNRFITFDPVPKKGRIKLEDYVYRGHAGPVFMVLPVEYQGRRATILRKMFPDYKNHKIVVLTSDYVTFRLD